MNQIFVNDQEVIRNILDTIDCIRSEKGLTLNRLANESEISENTVKHIFKKKTCPSLSTLIRICNALEIPLWEFFLLTSTEKMQPHKEYELLTSFEKLSPEHKDLVIYITEHLNK